MITETLPTGVIVSTNYSNQYKLEWYNDTIYLTKEDIARLYGIAFPVKMHGSCEIKPPSENNLQKE